MSREFFCGAFNRTRYFCHGLRVLRNQISSPLASQASSLGKSSNANRGRLPFSFDHNNVMFFSSKGLLEIETIRIPNAVWQSRTAAGLTSTWQSLTPATVGLQQQGELHHGYNCFENRLCCGSLNSAAHACATHTSTLKLAAIGCPTAQTQEDANGFGNLAESMLAHNRETARLLADYQCPVDWRIQRFLDEYLYQAGACPRLPSQTFILDRQGLARALSLPCEGDEICFGYCEQLPGAGKACCIILSKDRRTTQGVFHVAEGAYPFRTTKRPFRSPHSRACLILHSSRLRIC
jgi:hypothetical protein